MSREWDLIFIDSARYHALRMRNRSGCDHSTFYFQVMVPMVLRERFKETMKDSTPIAIRASNWRKAVRFSVTENPISDAALKKRRDECDLFLVRDGAYSLFDSRE